jgi:hypothetical protein
MSHLLSRLRQQQIGDTLLYPHEANPEQFLPKKTKHIIQLSAPKQPHYKVPNEEYATNLAFNFICSHCSTSPG